MITAAAGPKWPHAGSTKWISAGGGPGATLPLEEVPIMDANLYLIEWWATERLAEERAAAVRAKLVQSLRARRPLRIAVGLVRVTLGRRIGGCSA
jgi:2-polyprenyl-6-methoxyphenol hydroxylase-like FAD-dependent oxidoreductase